MKKKQKQNNAKRNAPFHRRAPPLPPCVYGDEAWGEEALRLVYSRNLRVRARAKIQGGELSPERASLFVERFGVVDELEAAARAFAFSTSCPSHAAPLLCCCVQLILLLFALYAARRVWRARRL